MGAEIDPVQSEIFFGRKIFHKKPVLGWIMIALAVGLVSAIIIIGVQNNAPGYQLGVIVGQVSIYAVPLAIFGYINLKDRNPKGGLLLKDASLEITYIGLEHLEIPYKVLHSAKLTCKGRSELIELVPLMLETFLETIPKIPANIIKARIRSGSPGIPLYSYQMEDPLGTISAELNRRIMAARTEAIADSSLLPTPML